MFSLFRTDVVAAAMCMRERLPLCLWWRAVGVSLLPESSWGAVSSPGADLLAIVSRTTAGVPP